MAYDIKRNDKLVGLKESLETVTSVEECACTEVEAECCQSECTPITLEKCDDNPTAIIPVSGLNCSGRVLELTLEFGSVCKSKRLAVAIFLEDEDGNKYGYKIIEVPAQAEGINECAQLTVTGICLPVKVELCEDKTLYVHVLANYLDYSFELPECYE